MNIRSSDVWENAEQQLNKSGHPNQSFDYDQGERHARARDHGAITEEIGGEDKFSLPIGSSFFEWKSLIRHD